MTLIEILVSLLILSITLLGFDALELTVARKTINAYYFVIATEQMYSIVERLRVHPKGFTEQMHLWNQENQFLLPASKGLLSQNNSSYQITLFWGQKTNKRICKESLNSQLHCLTVSIMKDPS